MRVNIAVRANTSRAVAHGYGLAGTQTGSRRGRGWAPRGQCRGHVGRLMRRETARGQTHLALRHFGSESRGLQICKGCVFVGMTLVMRRWIVFGREKRSRRQAEIKTVVEHRAVLVLG